jgi:hypothetical protein
MAEFNGWNPYYNPEKCGLRLIDSISHTDEPYEFDITCVWQDIETGRYYTAHDSGCSCPTPFEDFKFLSDLTEIPSHEVKRITGHF